jgi:predicted metal-dependent hydrolase
VIKKHHLARHIRVSIRPDGTVQVSMPTRTSLKRAEMLIDSARPTIRRLRNQYLDTKVRHEWKDGVSIGSSHMLRLVRDTSAKRPWAKIVGQQLCIGYDDHVSTHELKVFIDDEAKKILRVQARAYLSRRLPALAERMDCRYEKIRYSNAGTRWGSCSSRGTISLNVWLMTLDKELIDYVLIHELAHTKHMNHSPRFWAYVERFDPDFRLHRREIKKYSPMP